MRTMTVYWEEWKSDCAIDSRTNVGSFYDLLPRVDRSKLASHVAQALQMVSVSDSTVFNLDHSLLDSFLDLPIRELFNSQPVIVGFSIRRLKVAVTISKARSVVSRQ